MTRRDLAALLVLGAMVAAGAWLIDSATRHELPPPLWTAQVMR